MSGERKASDYMGSNSAGKNDREQEGESELLKTPQTGPVPPSTATFQQVREYLTSLLKDRHQLPDDYVQNVVTRWAVGSGRELRNYTPQM